MQATSYRSEKIPWRTRTYTKPVFKLVPKYEEMRARRLRERLPSNYGPFPDESRSDFDQYRVYLRNLNRYDAENQRYENKRNSAARYSQKYKLGAVRDNLDQFARRKGYPNFPTYYKQDPKKIGFGDGPVSVYNYGGRYKQTERGKKALAAIRIKRFLRKNKISNRSDNLDFQYKLLRRDPEMGYHYNLANTRKRKTKRKKPEWFEDLNYIEKRFK